MQTRSLSALVYACTGRYGALPPAPRGRNDVRATEHGLTLSEPCANFGFTTLLGSVGDLDDA